MTIEIADRLIKLRKKYGYSQEELADKLGLSRQAVSKWERAEASPDTDNLICLAKIYGVSLDDLLATDEDVETIVEEQVKSEDAKEEEEPEEEKEVADEVVKDKVVIDDTGIHISDDDGSRISINRKGIHVFEKDGKQVHVGSHAIVGAVEGLLFLLAVVAYILLGSLLNMWYNAWVVFFIPEILCSIARCFIHKNANKFNAPFASTFAFFFVCMVIPGLSANLWHPMWTVFFFIPIYYTTVGVINKIIGKKDDDDDEEDKDEEDDD